MVVPFRFLRRDYERPCGEVDRRVVIRMGSKSAMQTLKFILTLAIGLGTMAATGTGATAVARIDRDNRHAVQLPFVGQEGSQLRKSPASHFGPLASPEPGSVADMRQILNRNAASSAFGQANELFTNNMVLVSAKPLFLVADAFHGVPGVAARGTFAAHFLPKTPADRMVFLPHFLHGGSRYLGAIAGGDNVGHSHIHAKISLGLDRSIFRKVRRTHQVKFVILANQVRFALDAVKALPLVLPTDIRNAFPSGQGENADNGRALKSKEPIINGHGSMGIECRAPRFITYKTRHGLAYGLTGHLTGQSVEFTQVIVTPAVNVGSREIPGFKADSGGMGRGEIKRFHGGKKQVLLFRRGQQLELQSQFHGCIVGSVVSFVKRERPPFLRA